MGTFPDHNFLGEEDLEETSSTADSEFTWIVDPLDGTTNYVHGLENYSVSVALQRNDEIVVGAIYDPVRDHCYSASLGNGSYLNGSRLSVSRVMEIKDALIAASLPARVERESDEISRFVEVTVRCQAIRRLGSAALNLCFLAAGQLDAYWATSVKKWDVAAGLLIVQEAGGRITALDGTPLDIEKPKFVAAGHSSLHTELVELFSK